MKTANKNKAFPRMMFARTKTLPLRHIASARILHNTLRFVGSNVKKPTTTVVTKVETYTERQIKLGRPMSPHVGIYRFPPVALSSITNRITGITLSIGMTAIGALALGNYDVAELMNTIGNSSYGGVAKFGVSFPFLFHYFAAIRHFIWNEKPEFTLTNEKVQKTSYLIFAMAVVGSGGPAFLTM